MSLSASHQIAQGNLVNRLGGNGCETIPDGELNSQGKDAAEFCLRLHHMLKMKGEASTGTWQYLSNPIRLTVVV